MADVKVELLNTIVTGSPGETVTAFGHAFTIQPDGNAHAFVDEGFVKAEVAAGRYHVIEDKGGHLIAPRKDLLVDVNLGFEITNCFGTNDINKLNEQIKNLTDEQIRLFSETRLELNFPDSMTHKKMVDQIMKITKKANPVPPVEVETKVEKKPEVEKKTEVTPKTQDEILGELEKLEKDMKKDGGK